MYMWLLSWSFCLCHCSCHWVHLLCYVFEEFHWNNELLVRPSVILVMFINISIFPCFFRYNLQSDVRAAMYEEAEKWMRAVGRRKFMGGSAPNLADLVLLYYFTENKSDHNTTHLVSTQELLAYSINNILVSLKWYNQSVHYLYFL